MTHNRRTSAFSRRVGLDIGGQTVKAVEVVERGPDLVVRSAGAAPIPGVKSKQDLPDHGATVQAVKNLWAAAKLGTSRVVLALPPDAVYTKWLHLEAADRESLDMTARAAATRGAPFPPEDAVVDYRILSSRGASARNVHFVMLVAASATVIDSLLNIAEAAGLEPLAVDIGAAAALRCFDTQRRTSSMLWSGEPLAHCIIGARSTTITVMRGRELEFARTVPVGGSDLTECVADFCGVSWSEAEKIKGTPGARLVEAGSLIAPVGDGESRIPCENVVGRLAREIQRSLKFFRSQFAEGSYLGMIGAITMSGGGALMKGLDACLEAQGVEISGVLNPFTGLSVEAEAGVQRIGDTAAQYSVAIGLALGDYWSSPNGAAASAEMAA